MSNLPENIKYLASHEWARLEEDGTVTVGITDHAQDQLGDVVYVEVPEKGSEFAAGDEASVVESVKAASDIYMPVSGEIIAVNDQLDTKPELVNSDPYGDGWFFKIQPTDITELDNMLDSAGYQATVDADAE
ncbi:MAG: glycine cleavage system protein GcvH [Pseudomonadales bacterium]|jgi:glycine cleavage system H protein|nr:glycine cleavage system protein GcvH [Pseudomonadales bacterium]